MQLDTALAALRFRQARQLASAGKVPAEWVARVHQIEKGERTYLAVLATALLAKATAPRADVLALRPSGGPGGYAARGFAKDVVVPLAFEAGVDLRTGGDDPLANQPFFQLTRVDQPDVRVRSTARYQALVDALRAANGLDAGAATAALAALIHVRSGAQSVDFAAGTAARSIGKVIEAARAFVTEDPEDGRRGQAFVAAVFDLVFEGVETGSVNDPSRKRPGDVRVVLGGKVTFSVEVRQKPVTPTQIRQFARRLKRDAVGRGAVALLSPRQRRVEVSRLRAEALREHDVQLEIMDGVEAALRQGLQWSKLPIREAVPTFIARMGERLAELRVRRGSLETWRHLATESPQ